MRDFTPEIRAYALRNALRYGKAEPGTILAKLFTHGLPKNNIKDVMPLVHRIVGEVNALTPEARAQAFAGMEQLVVEHVEREKELPPLPNAVHGNVVTRFPPEPSKHLHVGHALALLLNYSYAQRYGGRFLVRLEDCNPEKCTQEYADSIIADITEYLGIEPASLSYVSDDMPVLLQYAEQLLEKGVAYVCQCAQEEMREMRHAGKACACRERSMKETKKLWKDFIKGRFTEGGAVLRYKGNMQADNQIMRDPVLWRRVDAPHFRHKTKYPVWPLYDFYNAIEDSTKGVTHVLRSAEFTQRAELQNALKKHLGLPVQTIVEFGRFTVAEKTTHGRELRALVESGDYRGWDDPRLMTLKALRRRGISKDVLNALTTQIGLKKSDVLFEFPMIAALSRKLIDAKTERYTFIPNPVTLTVPNAPELTEIQLPIHPDKPETRIMRITPGVVLLSENDWKEYKGKELRLVHGYNLTLDAQKKQGRYTSLENKPLPKVTWLSTFSLPARVLMDDGTWIEGNVLEEVESLPVGTVVQFERFGFCKLDRVIPPLQGKAPVYEFWYTHA